MELSWILISKDHWNKNMRSNSTLTVRNQKMKPVQAPLEVEHNIFYQALS